MVMSGMNSAFTGRLTLRQGLAGFLAWSVVLWFLTADYAPARPSEPGTERDSFEDCCRRLGCATGGNIAACSTYDPLYGRCTIGAHNGLCVSATQCRGDWYPTPGYCPGPADIQCCRPPAGSDQPCDGTNIPLPNIGIEPESLDPRCPAGMQTVDESFCMDVYEAYIEEILLDGSIVSWSPYFNPGYRNMRARSAAGAVPQGYINANQAEAACQNSGKRLCTDTEWLRGCQGAAGFTYPYGPYRIDGLCNDARDQHPAVEYFGRADPTPFAKIWHPCLNQLPNSLDPTGYRVACESADGMMDMMGNLHEWTAAPAGTFRGGFYVDTRINGNGCRYVTTAHNRFHWDYSTGFRCCADFP
ncbi:MAG: SUMF1/EgtB/PvdO family nonheme iron enzyme [Acidobacteria bacterium]|nr:SUMF1/EgtB/PvdO family nonheme iron enzyme [Acidobacteriota bacterium]MBI3658222.1 SUMF1/EgtB/PvdO family nonheme iron enzyme [Acidobacteriota bacterium]